MSRTFRVERVDYGATLPALRAVRDVVFVQEQKVPEAIERDELDPVCCHVLATDASGAPVGTGRLSPTGKLGRMAVLRAWRGAGVGRAMLRALVDEARTRGLHELVLHAQVDAEGFYAAEGFLPVGPRFDEAGIAHQAMRRLLAQPAPVESLEQATAATVAVLAGARRGAFAYSRAMDPGLLDRAEVLAACRRLGTRGAALRLLLQDVATPQRSHAPLIGLVQRLPSAFEVRVVEEPVDLNYPSAFIANDAGGWYFRTLGHRMEGEAQVDAPARARQLRAVFDEMWERARPATELRALGI